MLEPLQSLSTSELLSLSVIAISALGLVVFSLLESLSQRRRGTVLLFGGLTLTFATMYAVEYHGVVSTTVGLWVAVIAFVLVNIGGYSLYRDATE